MVNNSWQSESKADRKTQIREQLGKHKALNGIILALTLLLLGNMAAAGFSLAEEVGDAGVGENSLLWQLESGDYPSMVEMMYLNEACGVKATETMKECYAVAEYFEAASYQRAYERDGQEEKAACYEKKMEDCRARMGTLAFTADDIGRILEDEGDLLDK